MSLVSSKVEQDVPDWSLPGLAWVIVATPAFLLAAVAAGLFALLISPFALMAPKQWRTPAPARRVGILRTSRLDGMGGSAKQPLR